METLEEAKQNFLVAAAQIEPLAPIKKRPFISVGCAFAGGILVALLQKSSRSLAVLPLLIDGADLAIKMFLDRRK